MYFKQRVDEIKADNNEKINELSHEASDSDPEDDAFSKLKTKFRDILTIPTQQLNAAIAKSSDISRGNVLMSVAD